MAMDDEQDPGDGLTAGKGGQHHGVFLALQAGDQGCDFGAGWAMVPAGAVDLDTKDSGERSGDANGNMA